MIPPRPVATLLTTRRFHPMVIALVRACAAEGLDLRPSRGLDPAAVFAFQWGYDRVGLRGSLRAFCAAHGIEFMNPRVMGKWSQTKRFLSAKIPVPSTRLVRSASEALVAARALGFPVVLKPLFGLQSQGVVLVRGERELLEKWRPRHRVAQEYLPEGNRCVRLLVVGDRVVSAVTRVAKDGFHATYAHGRRGTLRPFFLTPALEKLAVAACRALEVSVGGVDMVMTAAGPVILEVNHRRVDYADRALHGRGAVRAVARYLAERARFLRPVHPLVKKPKTLTVALVTDLADSSSIGFLRDACERKGLRVRIGPRLDVFSRALAFWGLSPGRYVQESVRAQTLSLPAVNGRSLNLWQQRGLLYRSGLKVPRSRLAPTLAAGIRLAEVVGFPLFLGRNGDPQNHTAVYVDGRNRLESAWTEDGPRILEEARWAAQSLLRVWVAGDRVVHAERGVRPDLNGFPSVWRSVDVTAAQHAAALQSCRGLEVDAGIVEMASEPDGETILRVMHRWIPLEKLPKPKAALLCEFLAQRLKDLASSPPVQADVNLSRPGVSIVLARSLARRGSGHRIWNIHSLYRELARRNGELPTMRGRYDRELADAADLILQDPLHAFGFGRRSDRLNRTLRERHPEKSHLLRSRGIGEGADKRVMARLARRLGVRAPPLLTFRQALGRLPVIVKPRRGSLGRGVRLVKTPAALKRFKRQGHLLQAYVPSGTDYAVSIRAVTVGPRVSAAAVFYRRNAVCSNLARGARAVALTGPGRESRVTPEETLLLEKVGIDPRNRTVPTEVVEMAARVGRHYAARGVQMLGQDYIVDERRRWHFLEANLAFGVAVFNVTDGDGTPSQAQGFTHAGRVLFQSLEEWRTRRIQLT